MKVLSDEELVSKVAEAIYNFVDKAKRREEWETMAIGIKAFYMGQYQPVIESVISSVSKDTLRQVREILDGINTNVDPHSFGTGCPSCGEEVGTAGEVEMGVQIGKDRAIQTIKQRLEE